MDEKLKEWKDQWNNGDVKLVPELFELVEELLEEVEAWRDGRIVVEELE